MTNPTINWRKILFETNAPGWSILVRLLVGLVVFLPEGIQKLAFPDELGAGRFANIGIPYPDLMAPFVGVVEIICGTLIILGLLTRLAAIPLIIIMIVAMQVTAYDPARAASEGTLSYLFSVMEYLYVLLLLWLAVYGGGTMSLDRFIRHDTTT